MSKPEDGVSTRWRIFVERRVADVIEDKLVKRIKSSGVTASKIEMKEGKEDSYMASAIVHFTEQKDAAKFCRHIANSDDYIVFWPDIYSKVIANKTKVMCMVNLPKDITEESIKELCSQNKLPDPVSVEIVVKAKNARATVSFRNAKTATKAVNTFNKMKVDDQTIFGDWDVTSDYKRDTVEIHNLPDETEATEVRSIFEDCGVVRKVIVSEKNTAIVEFVNAAGAKSALRKSGVMVGDNKTIVALYDAQKKVESRYKYASFNRGSPRRKGKGQGKSKSPKAANGQTA